MKKTQIESLKNCKIIKLETSTSKSGVQRLHLLNSGVVLTKAGGYGYNKTEAVLSDFFRKIGFVEIPDFLNIDNVSLADFLNKNNYKLNYLSSTLSGTLIEISKNN